MLAPAGIGVEPRIHHAGLDVLHCRAEIVPEVLFHDAEDQRAAVGGLEQIVHRPDMRARIGILTYAVAQRGAEQSRFVKAQVQLGAAAAAVALVQCCEYGDSAEAAALHVRDRYARSRRLA